MSNFYFLDFFTRALLHAQKLLGGMSRRLCGEWAGGYVVVAHVIIVSAQSKELGFWFFFDWMSQGGHYEQLLFFTPFYQSTPSCLKVGGGVVVVGWVAHVIIVSAPVQRIGFLGFLDLVWP